MGYEFTPEDDAALAETLANVEYVTEPHGEGDPDLDLDAIIERARHFPPGTPEFDEVLAEGREVVRLLLEAEPDNEVLKATDEHLEKLQVMNWNTEGQMGHEDTDLLNTTSIVSLVASTMAVDQDCGCALSTEPAQVGTSPTYLRVDEETGETVAEVNAPAKQRWAGILGMESELTGDGRFIQPEAIRWENLPIPLRHVSQDVGAHNGAVVVGRIDTVERLSVEEANERLAEMGQDPLDEDDNLRVLWGAGDFDLGSKEGRESVRLVGERFQNGVSMDLDDVAFEVRVAADAPALMAKDPIELAQTGEADEDGRVKVQEMAPDDEVMVTTDARMRAATIVSVPAFSRANIFLVQDEVETFSLDLGDEEDEEETRNVKPKPLKIRLSLGGETFEVEYDDSPDETFNWVEDVGGLPQYIKRIAKHLQEKGKSEGHAIAIAVNAVKKMCATGDVNFPGKQDVNAGSRAEACAAVADWERKKAQAKADSGETETMSTAVKFNRRTGKVSTFTYDKDQWRNPKNGRWIDMPDIALEKLLEALEDLPGFDGSDAQERLGEAIGDMRAAKTDDAYRDVLPDVQDRLDDVEKMELPPDAQDELDAARNAVDAYETSFIPSEQSDLTGDEGSDIGSGDFDPDSASDDEFEAAFRREFPDMEVAEVDSENNVVVTEDGKFFRPTWDDEAEGYTFVEMSDDPRGESGMQKARREQKEVEAGERGPDVDIPEHSPDTPEETDEPVGDLPYPDAGLGGEDHEGVQPNDVDLDEDGIVRAAPNGNLILRNDTPEERDARLDKRDLADLQENLDNLLEIMENADEEKYGPATMEMLAGSIRLLQQAINRKAAKGEDSLTAAAAPLDLDAPPVAHFNQPMFDGPTPLTIDPDGRVYGHLAVWGTCHTTHTARGKCVVPPKTNTNYAYFATGSVITKEGAEIPTGPITLNTGHAKDGMSVAQTLAHYDNTGTAVADVVMGEDAYGIWFSGSLRPGVTAKQVRALRASPLSGDWRMMRGNLELVAALAVNVQGFPVPRPKGRVRDGRMTSLVAAGMLPPKKVRRADVESGALSKEDIRYLKALAARERREHEERTLATLSNAADVAARLRSTQKDEALAKVRATATRLRAQQMAARLRDRGVR